MKVAIDSLLTKQGKTRYWLSNETGITYTNITNLCNNKTSSIKFDMIKKICKALSCTPNDIFDISK